MKFIKKIFLSLTFLFIGLNPNLYSMEETGANVPIAESTASWFDQMPKMPSLPKLPSMPEMPTFSFRDTLNSVGSGLGSFVGYNGPFKFAHSGAEELALLNEQKSSVLNIAQELLKSAQTLENVGSETDVASILQSRECLNPFVENLEQQADLIKTHAVTRYIEQPNSWLDWFRGYGDTTTIQETTYPLHNADGYAADFFESKQEGFSKLEQCLGSVENQELIAPLKAEVLQGQDEVNAQVSQLRLTLIKDHITKAVKQAWEIPAVKVALATAGAALAPIILYKLYRAILYPVRGFKGMSHNTLVKKEIALGEEITELNRQIAEYRTAPRIQDQEQRRQDLEAQKQRILDLGQKSTELTRLLETKRNYQQYSYSTVATRPYIWSAQKLGSLGYNSVAKPYNGTKWVFNKVFRRNQQAPVVAAPQGA